MAVPAVVDRDAGFQGLRITADPPNGLVRGVSVTAQADGRYSIELCLIAEIVPLHELAEQVASAVQERFDSEGFATQLGAVSVEFADVLTSAEIVARRARKQEEALAAIVPVVPAAAPPPTGAVPPPPGGVVAPVAVPPPPVGGDSPDDPQPTSTQEG